VTFICFTLPPVLQRHRKIGLQVTFCEPLTNLLSPFTRWRSVLIPRNNTDTVRIRNYQLDLPSPILPLLLLLPFLPSRFFFIFSFIVSFFLFCHFNNFYFLLSFVFVPSFFRLFSLSTFFSLFLFLPYFLWFLVPYLFPFFYSYLLSFRFCSFLLSSFVTCFLHFCSYLPSLVSVAFLFLMLTY
jgi:hypothetical protein